MLRIILVFWLLCSMNTMSYAKDMYSLALITTRAAHDPYWEPVETLVRKACDDLGMNITVYYADSSRDKFLASVRDAISNNTDVIFFPNFKKVAYDVLQLASQHKTKIFIFDSGIAKQNQDVADVPRGKFKAWIGELVADDEKAGYVLANTLFDRAEDLGLVDEKGLLQVVAINGPVSEVPSQKRFQGLKRAIEQRKNVRFMQVVYADWDMKNASLKASSLYKRYPRTTVFWAASDLMALGIEESLRIQHGLKIGKDFVVGGIDWTKQGLKAVADNQLTTSVGGQMYIAPYATVLIYDYLHGIDFAEDDDIGLQASFQMRAIHVEEVELLMSRYEGGWNSLNFRDLSMVYNPKLRAHPIGLDFFTGK